MPVRGKIEVFDWEIHEIEGFPSIRPLLTNGRVNKPMIVLSLMIDQFLDAWTTLSCKYV